MLPIRSDLLPLLPLPTSTTFFNQFGVALFGWYEHPGEAVPLRFTEIPMEDLIEAIDEYNAAVELRNEPIVHDPAMVRIAEVIVQDHLKKFENLLGYEA